MKTKKLTIEYFNLKFKNVKEVYFPNEKHFLRLDGIRGGLRLPHSVCNELLNLQETTLFFVVNPSRCKSDEHRTALQQIRADLMKRLVLTEDDIQDWLKHGVSLKDFEGLMFYFKTRQAIAISELHKGLGRKEFFKRLLEGLIDPMVFDLPGFWDFLVPTVSPVEKPSKLIVPQNKVKKIETLKRLRPAYDTVANDLKEAAISRRLAKQWGAEREAPTPSGNIDLLTAHMLIEVKCGENWKHGIGQLVAYGFHKPDKVKVLYLSDYEKLDLDNVRDVCRNANIEVMLEP